MREFIGLFRGKRIDNGEWVEGNLLTLTDGRYFIVNNIFGACIDAKGNFINTEAPFVCEVDPDTVGECTALRDKNGKLIFEGDIVKCKHSMFRMNSAGFEEQKIRNGYGKEVIPQELGGVRCYYWRNYAVSICEGQIKLQNGSDLHYAKWSYIYNHEIEIIGNIHDNPELLKGGEGDG